MNIKTIFQIIISLIIVSILLIFYYTFFSNKSNEVSNLSKSIEKKVTTDKNILSELVNIEYKLGDCLLLLFNSFNILTKVIAP